MVSWRYVRNTNLHPFVYTSVCHNVHTNGTTVNFRRNHGRRVTNGLERFKRKLRRRPRVGGRVLAKPVAREWGGRAGYFADPEDNVWELAWMPGATFDEWGGLIWP
jgi:uncharacterized glyoxalase superfamily protein PhnB